MRTGLLGYLRSHAQRRRALTAILYLNADDWNCATEGGALRVYPHASPDCLGGVAQPNGVFGVFCVL